jgi:acyl-CoA ligase (AMP-forming) (exosortase A-associated)
MFDYGIAKHLEVSAARFPTRTALVDNHLRCSYAEFAALSRQCAAALTALDLPRFARVATYLHKSLECAVAIYAAAAAGFIIVPINPKLKAAQVRHILCDSGASVFITSPLQLRELDGSVDLAGIHCILTAPESAPRPSLSAPRYWHEWLAGADATRPLQRFIESDPAAILYTSGSTGSPKGVTLSHRNLAASAESVNVFFRTTEHDVFLALLPLSFDAGLSQLTTAIAKGASLILYNYIRAQEIVRLCVTEKITIIVGVPPLWAQLAAVPWQDSGASLRLFGNTGGHMYAKLLASLRAIFPNAAPFLMYGLTEAFRSSYLDPSEIERRPNSVGKAMPNVELLLLREDGSRCGPDEDGELVHRGPLVALGYWNDRERTAERFRPLTSPLSAGLLPEPAVWSGDIFRCDSEGFLYFVGRRDEMIKSSGYRMSPTEIETVLQAAPGVREAAVFPVADEVLGQIPMAAVVAKESPLSFREILAHCSRALPSYMVPRLIEVSELPRSANGKIDRVGLRIAQGARASMGAQP